MNARITIWQDAASAAGGDNCFEATIGFLERRMEERSALSGSDHLPKGTRVQI
jgi:hypothetical protein